MCNVTNIFNLQQVFWFLEVKSTLLLTVYGVYARSQADTSQGTFDYDTVKSYDLTLQCTDSVDTVTKTLAVNLVDTSNQASGSQNGTSNSW